jgi:hypothetical protein
VTDRPLTQTLFGVASAAAFDIYQYTSGNSIPKSSLSVSQSALVEADLLLRREARPALPTRRSARHHEDGERLF